MTFLNGNPLKSTAFTAASEMDTLDRGFVQFRIAYDEKEGSIPKDLPVLKTSHVI